MPKMKCCYSVFLSIECFWIWSPLLSRVVRFMSQAQNYFPPTPPLLFNNKKRKEKSSQKRTDQILNCAVPTEGMFHPRKASPGWYSHIICPDWRRHSPNQSGLADWQPPAGFWSGRFVFFLVCCIQTLCQTAACSEERPDPRITCSQSTAAASETQTANTRGCFFNPIFILNRCREDRENAGR